MLKLFVTIDKIEKVLVQTCLKHLNYGVPWPIPDCPLPRKCQLPSKCPCIGKRLVVKKRPGERKHFPFPNRKEKTFPFQTEEKTLSLSKLKSCFLSKTLNELQSMQFEVNTYTLKNGVRKNDWTLRQYVNVM